MPENSTVAITINYEAIGVWLRTSPELREHLKALGVKGVDYARGIAPVGARTTKTTAPGQYRDSLQYEVRTGRSRMYLVIFSNDYTAWWQEYGSKKTPKRAVLRRTLDYLAGSGGKSASDYGGIGEYDAANPQTQKRRESNRRTRGG
jgi:hypothetical protein